MLSSINESTEDIFVLWVHIEVSLGDIQIAEDSNNVVIRRDVIESERLGVDLLGVGLELVLRVTVLGELVPHLNCLIVVLNIESLAEEIPLLAHLIGLLIVFLVLLLKLSLLLSLLLFGESLELLLGLLLLLLELGKDLVGVILLVLLLLSNLGVAIRSVSQSHVTVEAWDVQVSVLSLKLLGILLE